MRRRVVDATYLSPTIPATTPPPFGVADGAHVVPVNELPDVVETPSEYVIVGAGKTATDAIVWLLLNGVETDRIVWVRPRDPWMLNRALVQPDPAVAIGLAADIMSSAADATSLDDMFLRLEAAGVMLRVDPDVVPTMAKTPTLGTWELDLLRSIERVVRKGHVRHVDGDEIVLRRRCRPAGDAPRWSCTARPRACSTRPWCPSGDRTRSGSRRSASGSPASAPPWPATSKPPVTTTENAIVCVLRTSTATAPRSGR